ncbi:MAG: hypothetical protein AAF467_27985 [Actinomycetota bacterium]
MSTTDVAALIMAVLVGAVACFQGALAAGAPWGDHSYGGRVNTIGGVLPRRYRAMSAVAVLMLCLAIWIVLARAGLVDARGVSDGILRVAIWVVVGFLALNTAANMGAARPIERYGFGAVTFISAVASLAVALS